MNTHFMLTLTHSKFNKVTMEGGYHCLLPTFRVHPVTHLVSFTLEERRKKNSIVPLRNNFHHPPFKTSLTHFVLDVVIQCTALASKKKL